LYRGVRGQRAAARVALLGRLTAELRRPLRVGDELVVADWPIAADGKKLHAGTVIYSAAGETCAIARALWVLTPGTR